MANVTNTTDTIAGILGNASDAAEVTGPMGIASTVGSAKDAIVNFTKSIANIGSSEWVQNLKDVGAGKFLPGVGNGTVIGDLSSWALTKMGEARENIPVFDAFASGLGSILQFLPSPFNNAWAAVMGIAAVTALLVRFLKNRKGSTQATVPEIRAELAKAKAGAAIAQLPQNLLPASSDFQLTSKDSLIAKMQSDFVYNTIGELAMQVNAASTDQATYTAVQKGITKIYNDRVVGGNLYPTMAKILGAPENFKNFPPMGPNFPGQATKILRTLVACMLITKRGSAFANQYGGTALNWLFTSGSPVTDAESMRVAGMALLPTPFAGWAMQQTKVPDGTDAQARLIWFLELALSPDQMFTLAYDVAAAAVQLANKTGDIHPAWVHFYNYMGGYLATQARMYHEAGDQQEAMARAALAAKTFAAVVAPAADGSVPAVVLAGVVPTAAMPSQPVQSRAEGSDEAVAQVVEHAATTTDAAAAGASKARVHGIYNGQMIQSAWGDAGAFVERVSVQIPGSTLGESVTFYRPPGKVSGEGRLPESGPISFADIAGACGSTASTGARNSIIARAEGQQSQSRSFAFYPTIVELEVGYIVVPYCVMYGMFEESDLSRILRHKPNWQPYNKVLMPDGSEATVTGMNGIPPCLVDTALIDTEAELNTGISAAERASAMAAVLSSLNLCTPQPGSRLFFFPWLSDDDYKEFGEFWKLQNASNITAATPAHAPYYVYGPSLGMATCAALLDFAPIAYSGYVNVAHVGNPTKNETSAVYAGTSGVNMRVIQVANVADKISAVQEIPLKASWSLATGFPLVVPFAGTKSNDNINGILRRQVEKARMRSAHGVTHADGPLSLLSFMGMNFYTVAMAEDGQQYAQMGTTVSMALSVSEASQLGTIAHRAYTGQAGSPLESYDRPAAILNNMVQLIGTHGDRMARRANLRKTTKTTAEPKRKRRKKRAPARRKKATGGGRKKRKAPAHRRRRF